MKLRVEKINNYKTILRRSGYALIYDRRRGQESFVRRLGSGHYPRLHLYVKEGADFLILDLHLDQKKASYSGYRMHNAEHDGEIVNREVERLRSIFPEVINDFSKSVLESDNETDLTEQNNKRLDVEESLYGKLDDDWERMFKDKKKKRKRFLFF